LHSERVDCVFKKLAADALGLSDIGAVIERKDFDKTDSDDYLMTEDNEKIFFLIKSRKDEYCFTNLALIHLDGESAISSKRLLKRYSYSTNKVSNVLLETAGTVDMDVEIKFTLGGEQFSIDVHKKHIEVLKDLYKALIKIAELVHDNEAHLEYAETSLDTAKAAIGRTAIQNANVLETFEALTKSSFSWLEDSRKKYKVKDFGFVFEKYINQ
jgi:hypothetical protein